MPTYIPIAVSVSFLMCVRLSLVTAAATRLASIGTRSSLPVVLKTGFELLHFPCRQLHLRIVQLVLLIRLHGSATDKGNTYHAGYAGDLFIHDQEIEMLFEV